MAWKIHEVKQYWGFCFPPWSRNVALTSTTDYYHPDHHWESFLERWAGASADSLLSTGISTQEWYWRKQSCVQSLWGNEKWKDSARVIGPRWVIHLMPDLVPYVPGLLHLIHLVQAFGLQTYLKLVENTYNSHGRDVDNGAILQLRLKLFRIAFTVVKPLLCRFINFGHSVASFSITNYYSNHLCVRCRS